MPKFVRRRGVDARAGGYAGRGASARRDQGRRHAEGRAHGRLCAVFAARRRWRDRRGDVTMAQSLAKTLGVRLEIVPTTWKTMQADLQADRFDIAMGGVSVTPDRAAVGDFSDTVMRDGKRPIVRCTDKELFTSIAAIDRPGVRVVVNPGGTNERFAKAD